MEQKVKRDELKVGMVVKTNGIKRKVRSIAPTGNSAILSYQNDFESGDYTIYLRGDNFWALDMSDGYLMMDETAPSKPAKFLVCYIRVNTSVDPVEYFPTAELAKERMVELVTKRIADASSIRFFEVKKELKVKFEVSTE